VSTEENSDRSTEISDVQIFLKSDHRLLQVTLPAMAEVSPRQTFPQVHLTA
jgi:hypothetical protein